jgi:hypothetical protein
MGIEPQCNMNERSIGAFAFTLDAANHQPEVAAMEFQEHNI